MTKVDRALRVIEGLSKSAHNLIIFRDEPEVWFQFYLGLYFDKTTFVLMEKKDEKLKSRLAHPHVKKVIVVDKFDEQSLKLATDIIAKIIKKKVSKIN